jgi:uncharacterized protein YukE
MANLVPNPAYEQLSQLYSQLEQDAPAMSAPLKWSVQTMAGGNGTCWTGPAAQAWASSLEGYSADCGTQVNNMLDEIRSALGTIPRQVTEQEAQAIARAMRDNQY